MDELTFRRRVYENPDTTDPEILRAAAEDPVKRLFLKETRQMNQRLKTAVNVDVPENLAHRLIWQQSAQQYNQQRLKQRWYVGVAASLALLIGITSSVWVMTPSDRLEDYALAHVTHLEKELPGSGYQTDLSLVNAKLASFGATLTDSIGDIEVANFCHLQLTRSLHVILNTPAGKMSVFVLPDDAGKELPDSFGNDIYEGKSFGVQKARIMVVGSKGADLTPLTEKLKHSIQFSA